MALRPLYMWELDKDGRPKLDRHGERVPHKRAGQPKDWKDYTEQEKEDYDDQVRLYRNGERYRAAQVVQRYEDAKRTLADT